ncbi:DUF4126 domain-containing protein [Aphanothece hegewaldii CCALA 016]|uniref:DUF4126 domain-containing protein n=1 Tax=Aphanothece hegewaldii CCALA 016 TaxID=2107694 RepID=A0A2T1LV44_9CHRO|nr:DUF4126 domain-containing protein [Aphanothece hegewaldii]PSF35555.1 DUF4126 domain-containing protein [Aphanothece hegewaldii CCALA 016]
MDTVGLDSLNQYTIVNTIISLLLGISLSAASGFRVFIPLLIMSLAALTGFLDLPTNFDWVGSNESLIVFAVASFLEIGAYYIPILDHVLDTIATPLAAAVGAFITASTVPPDMNPLIQWTLAIIAGGGSAGLIKSLTSIFRIGSTTATGGLANPIFATLELISSIALSVLAIALPIFAGFLVLGLFLYGGLRVRRLLLKRKIHTTPST